MRVVSLSMNIELIFLTIDIYSNHGTTFKMYLLECAEWENIKNCWFTIQLPRQQVAVYAVNEGEQCYDVIILPLNNTGYTHNFFTARNYISEKSFVYAHKKSCVLPVLDFI